jgi:hypothetical protein
MQRAMLAMEAQMDAQQGHPRNRRRRVPLAMSSEKVCKDQHAEE